MPSSVHLLLTGLRLMHCLPVATDFKLQYKILGLPDMVCLFATCNLQALLCKCTVGEADAYPM
jgi:hypothetical protein